MNQKLEAIANKASTDLIALVKDGEEKILEAWNAAEEEGQLNECPPKLKLSLAITLDLEKDAMETALSFGIKHKLSVSCSIPDPNQPELDGVSSVTISGGGTSVTIDSKAARMIRKTAEALSKQ